MKYQTNSPTVAKGMTTTDAGHNHPFEVKINGMGRCLKGNSDHEHVVNSWAVGFSPNDKGMGEHNHKIIRGG